MEYVSHNVKVEGKFWKFNYTYDCTCDCSFDYVMITQQITSNHYFCYPQAGGAALHDPQLVLGERKVRLRSGRQHVYPAADSHYIYEKGVSRLVD